MSDFDYSILEITAHRPWPLPGAPWVMTQSWHDVLFLHWRVDKGDLRRAVPRDFELDLFKGDAWLGIVPFSMTNVGPRALPTLPGISHFPELNVRTYVKVADRPGVYFFSLDAARWLPAATARALINLPYYVADMTVQRDRQRVHYDSSRRGDKPADFKAIYEPVGEPFTATPGSLEYFLTERYCLYHHHRGGQPYRLDIHHRPWPLQPAIAEVSANNMAAASDLKVTGAPEQLHFARRLDVVAWAPTRIHATATQRSASAVLSEAFEK